MALWLCCLDGDASTEVATSIDGWLLPTTLSPGRLVPPPLPWLGGAGRRPPLPFAIDCRLEGRFTPRQEGTAAAWLAPWLARPQALRLGGRPLLLLRGSRCLSHPHFGARRFRLGLEAAMARLGCDDGLLLACMEDDAVTCADAVLNPTGDPDQPPPRPFNYELFLRRAHNRRFSPHPWQIPAVFAPPAPLSDHYPNASAALYREWLQQQSAWSEFRCHDQPQAPVVITSWQGHRHWGNPQRPRVPPLPQLPQLPEPSESPGPAPATEAIGWGSLDPAHLAVCVHGFHLPVLERILEHLINARAAQGGVDLYLSVPHDRLEAAVALLQANGWPRVRVYAVENRGRDLAPFLLQLLPAVQRQGHRIFLKLHTKLSSHLDDGRPWGDHLLASLLDPTVLTTLVQRFAHQEQLGLLAPPGTLLPCCLNLGSNAPQLARLARLHGVDPRALLASSFIAGTMMAGRVACLEPLLRPSWSLEPFEPECGQTDGTLAHALERWIAVLVGQGGWRIEELPGAAGAVPGFGYAWVREPEDI